MNTVTTSSEKQYSPIENFYLLQRLVIGIVVLGGNELIQRLHTWEQTIDAEPEQVWSVKGFDEETTLDELAYFVLGSLLRLEKRGIKLAVTGLQVAEQTAQTTANFLHPFLDNPLTRPFSRPFASLMNRFEYEIQRSIRDGRFEDRHGQALARTSFEELVDELIDDLARNPEIMGLIQQQSTGMANVAIDGGRELIVSADTLVEAALRRLLRMTPRAELPGPTIPGTSQNSLSEVTDTNK